jgi:predicted nucleotide-binding protein (sugar kinase/HSP70/actin superfamily)
MKIGIPRALLYYQYSPLWEGFFGALGAQCVVSPETNREIVEMGQRCAVDEACLSYKIYLGHVAYLLDRCDAVFVPRIGRSGRSGTVCTRFAAIYDLVANTFRSDKIALLHYNIDLDQKENELSAFLKLGAQLGKTKAQSLFAYWTAKQAQSAAQMIAADDQKRRLAGPGVKILLIAHPYNTYDPFTGSPVVRALADMGAVPVLGCACESRAAIAASYALSETVPWEASRELLGAVALMGPKTDGIILLSAFPCGPDSMVNEIIIRRVKDKPILSLTLDGQEGTAGLETRIESFLDIIARPPKSDYVSGPAFFWGKDRRSERIG